MPPGLRVAAEAFADRAYEAGRLARVTQAAGTPSSTTPASVVSRAIRMAKEKRVTAIDGTIVELEADTICVHGDTPGADDLARRLRAGLEAAGVTGQGCRGGLTSSFSILRSTFPTMVLGSASRNATRAGTLYGASRSRQ